MSNELREHDIARKVAQSLSSEFGPEVVAEVEKQLADGAGGKRGFIPGWVTDAAAIAGLIIAALQLIKQLYSENKTDKKLDELKEMLEKDAPEPARIEAAARSKVLEKVVLCLPKPGGN